MEMTETREEAKSDAPLDSAASSSETTEQVEPPGHQCAWCDFAGSSQRSLAVHVSRKHPEHKDTRAPSRRAPTSPPPPPPAAAPAGPPPADLKELRTVTRRNIVAVGQMLEGVLVASHARVIMNPESRVPFRDTHLAYAVQLRADLATDVLIKHAATNETVMRIVQGFNKLFEGGEEAFLVGALGLSLMATLGRPAPDTINGMFAPDVFATAAQKDADIRQKIAMAQHQQEAAARNGNPQSTPQETRTWT